MKILYLGDVMGRSGRQAISNELPDLRARLKADCVVVNGENATGGMGLSGNHAQEILKAGADCITLGDHAFDQKDMLQFIETEPRIIRPLNFSKSAPGRGAAIFTATRGRKVLVAQVLQPPPLPFACIAHRFIVPKQTHGAADFAHGIRQRNNVINRHFGGDLKVAHKGRIHRTDRMQFQVRCSFRLHIVSRVGA